VVEFAGVKQVGSCDDTTLLVHRLCAVSEKLHIVFLEYEYFQQFYVSKTENNTLVYEALNDAMVQSIWKTDDLLEDDEFDASYFNDRYSINTQVCSTGHDHAYLLSEKIDKKYTLKEFNEILNSADIRNKANENVLLTLCEELTNSVYHGCNRDTKLKYILPTFEFLFEILASTENYRVNQVNGFVYVFRLNSIINDQIQLFLDGITSKIKQCNAHIRQVINNTNYDKEKLHNSLHLQTVLLNDYFLTLDINKSRMNLFTLHNSIEAHRTAYHNFYHEFSLCNGHIIYRLSRAIQRKNCLFIHDSPTNCCKIIYKHGEHDYNMKYTSCKKLTSLSNKEFLSLFKQHYINRVFAVLEGYNNKYFSFILYEHVITKILEMSHVLYRSGNQLLKDKIIAAVCDASLYTLYKNPESPLNSMFRVEIDGRALYEKLWKTLRVFHASIKLFSTCTVLYNNL
jgi:hypothetical protein